MDANNMQIMISIYIIMGEINMKHYTINHTIDIILFYRFKHEGVDGGDKYKCVHCGMRTGDKTKLDKHLQTHTGKNSKHICQRCSGTFNSENELDTHKKNCECMKTKSTVKKKKNKIDSHIVEEDSSLKIRPSQQKIMTLSSDSDSSQSTTILEDPERKR